MDFTNNDYIKTKKIIKSYFLKKFYYYSEDDISDIILKIIDNYGKFDIKYGSYSNWVINISRNHMIDKFKRKSRIIYTSENLPEDITSLKNETNIKYDYDVIYNEIATILSPDDINMLHMKYVEGYDYREIGEKFNITSSTASNKVNYIKTKLKKNKGSNSLIYSLK